jgi:hypothetical protein
MKLLVTVWSYSSLSAVTDVGLFNNLRSGRYSMKQVVVLWNNYLKCGMVPLCTHIL